MSDIGNQNLGAVLEINITWGLQNIKSSLSKKMELALKRVVLGFHCFREQLHLSPTNRGTEAFSFCFRLRQSAAYYAFPFAPFSMLLPFPKSTEKPHCFGLCSWDWNKGNYQVWIPVWRLCFSLCYYILFKITTEI